MGTVYTYRLLWAEQVQIHIDRRFRMVSSAGSLDLERPGVNGDVATAFTYNGDGTVATIVKTYNDGVTTATYTKTFTYTSGQVTGISKWVKS